MKYKGSKSLCNTQRDRELYRAYLKELATATHINIRQICEKVVMNPCSQFWISEERAREVIRQLDAGIPIDVVAKGKKCYNSKKSNEIYRSMILELYSVFKRMKAENPEASNFELTCMAVNSPASQFFLTPESARKCIYRYRKCQTIMSRLKFHASFVSHKK